MSKQVIFGAGPVGRSIAEVLARRGDEVLLASRSGTGPEIPGTTRVAVDAADGAAVRTLATGATAIYNGINPAYHRWASDWPPIARALLSGAEHSGAVLVTASNLYGYGPVAPTDQPITPEHPLATTGHKGRVRVQMFQEAQAAHQLGRVRMVEIRAADYVGPGAQSHLGDRMIPGLLAGKRKLSVLGDPAQPHTWTYTRDVGRFATIVADRPDAWGQAWHVPSNPPRSQTQAIADFAEAAGVTVPRLTPIPHAVLRLFGLVNPTVRELEETRHQLTGPFVMDSTRSQQLFGMAPTPWDDVVSATLASFRDTPGRRPASNPA